MRPAYLPGSMTVIVIAASVACGQHRIIYEGESAYNSITVTEDCSGLRTLSFDAGRVRQSVVKVGDPDHLELPYARTMCVGLAARPEPPRVLIVGLGGGSLPMLFRRHWPAMQIDVVDIDPGVIDAARKFFGFCEDPQLRAVAADGRKFIEECRQPYDVIFLDAFGSDNIPYALATKEFLKAVRSALKPDGLVVANIWSSVSNPLYNSMVRTYQDVFDNVYVVRTQNCGNEIFLALPDARLDREKLAQATAEMVKRKELRYDIAETVRWGFTRPPINTAGHVLTDANPPPKTPAENN